MNQVAIANENISKTLTMDYQRKLVDLMGELVDHRHVYSCKSSGSMTTHKWCKSVNSSPQVCGQYVHLN